MAKYTEFKACCALLRWWDFYSRVSKIPTNLLFHCPNQSAGGRVNGANLKAMGVRSGQPDYMLAIARGLHHGLFIEMKSDVGVVSPDQKRVMQTLTIEGYMVTVCRSSDEARRTIESYLAL